jgi:hypothetical protein
MFFSLSLRLYLEATYVWNNTVISFTKPNANACLQMLLNLCLFDEGSFVMPCVGNLTEVKSSVFNEISRISSCSFYLGERLLIASPVQERGFHPRALSTLGGNTVVSFTLPGVKVCLKMKPTSEVRHSGQYGNVPHSLQIYPTRCLHYRSH